MKFGSLQVRTPDGVSRDFPIDLPSLVLGRADGNGIVIDDLSVSRRHARIVIESGHLLIEDLGSAAGTFVDGHRIESGTSNIVELDQSLRFGDVQALFVPAPPIAPSENESATLFNADGTTEVVEEAPSAAIRIQVTSPLTPVEPGGAVFATAIIHNRGRVVDLVTLGITGVPATWVTFSQNTLAIVPGSRESITLVFQPPLTSESLSGEYDFGVVVNSGEHEREGIDFGRLVVLPFEKTELSLSPLRSKRNFVLTAKNSGNTLVTYSLGGNDEEANFLFDFEAPSVDLQPGQERKIPLRVRKKRRKLFGRPFAAPFNVTATPTTGRGETVNTAGQLLIQPPLERWKGPAILAFIVALVATALWVSWIYRERMPTWVPWSTKDSVSAVVNTPELPYAGVHMCEKTEKEREKALAKVKPLPAGTTGAPLFAQNNPAWADDEYANAKDPETGKDWCGETIEQCGCALTSVATIMAVFQITMMPDGSDLTPQSVNAWFNEEARKTSRGWVSKGYVYGDVIWTAANELSGQIAKQRPGTPTVRFAGFFEGTPEEMEKEIRAELKAGRPLVIEVPGHYVAAIKVNPDNDKIIINDPYYADRKTLDAYEGKVKSLVKFEPNGDLSAVAITVPRDLRVQVVKLNDKSKIVGSLNLDESTSKAPVGITDAQLSSRDAWRDPTCVESPPPVGAGTTTIFLPGNRDDYTINVLNPSAGGTSIAIHSYDQDGNASLETRDTSGAATLTMSYDPAKAAIQLQVIQGNTPATATPGSGTPTGSTGTGGLPGIGTGNNPTTAPTTVPGVSPTATRTPVPTPAPIPPAGVVVKCEVVYTPVPVSAGVTCTGTVTGTATTTRWSLNGLPAPVPPGSTAFSTVFTQDTVATVEMTACNGTACKTAATPVVIKFVPATASPPPTAGPGTPTPIPTVPPVGPPPVVNATCISFPYGSGTQIDCSTSFSEAFNTITWTTTGPAIPASQSGGSKQFTTFGPDSGTVTVQAQVCFNAVCSQSNVAIVQIGKIVSEISSNLCVVPLVPSPLSTPYEINGQVTNWNSSRPYPTGTMTWVINGNIVGTSAIQPGEVGSEFTFLLGYGGVGIPLTIQYSGDSNWTAAAISCTFEAL